jgi:hypothetical protein
MVMGKQYRFKVAGDYSKKLDFLKGTAAQRGIDFNGDTNKGSFWGHGMMCNYFRVGDEMIVNIESVPQGVTFEQIEKMIEDFFKQ